MFLALKCSDANLLKALADGKLADSTTGAVVSSSQPTSGGRGTAKSKSTPNPNQHYNCLLAIVWTMWNTSPKIVSQQNEIEPIMEFHRLLPAFSESYANARY
ncbi:hypothetical protein CVS40_5023 [Lucilia cuprina]|nr:hypothetical protein CVS40_5023 [Lucilia cuprina]